MSNQTWVNEKADEVLFTSDSADNYAAPMLEQSGTNQRLTVEQCNLLMYWNSVVAIQHPVLREKMLDVSNRVVCLQGTCSMPKPNRDSYEEISKVRMQEEQKKKVLGIF